MSWSFLHSESYKNQKNLLKSLSRWLGKVVKWGGGEDIQIVAQMVSIMLPSGTMVQWFLLHKFSKFLQK